MVVTDEAFDAVLVESLAGSDCGVIFATYQGELIYARMNNGALELVDPMHVSYGGESGLRYMGEPDAEV